MSAELKTENAVEVNLLTVQLLAAETNLTHFAARHGKDSKEYRTSLYDFAAIWSQLQKARNPQAFLEEIIAA